MTSETNERRKRSMRWPARKRFKTYRKQARTLKLDDETRDRTLQVIHALEAERERNQACAATASAQAFPAPTTTKTAIPALKSHSRRKRPHALRTPLKAAACIVLTVGLATVAVAAPTVVETAMHTVPKVGANEPLRPYQRIEFTDASFSYLGAEQPYTVPQKYDPDEQCYGSAVVRLFLPGSLNEPLEVSVLGAQDVRVCGEDPYTARLDIPAEKTSISLTEENGYTFSLIRPVNITEKQFNDLFSDNGRAICTDDMLAELLDSLRNISISVKTSDSVRTYRLDFSDLPDVRSIRLALVHKEYRPIMATLVQESCSYDTL